MNCELEGLKLYINGIINSTEQVAIAVPIEKFGDANMYSLSTGVR